MNQFNHIKAILRNNIINIRGWTTDRKILVIESDDWGTVRMQSKKAYKLLLQKGYPVDKNSYNRFDALESDEDIEALLNTLNGIRNREGQSPKFTINNIVANPDFGKIKMSGFNHYFYEPFYETLKKYPGSDNVIKLYSQGIDANLIYPQLHGREHVNVINWMRDLKNSLRHVKDAFEFEMFSLHTNFVKDYPMEYMDSLAPSVPSDNDIFKEILKDATQIFERIWGFKSETFIAPCFIWDSSLNLRLEEFGVNGIQGQYYQNQPSYNKFKYKTIYHYMGEKIGLNQYYILRNVDFEPTDHLFSFENTLKQIDIAFKWRKPAIISSHRLNYIGRIHSFNRIYGLNQLSRLLKTVIRKYPNVEFMTSNELLKLFKN